MELTNLEIKDYWLLLRKFRFLIASSIFVSVIFSLYYTQSQTPLFKAYAQLYVSIPNTVFDPGSNQIAQLAAGGSFTQARVFSYAQILNSPSVLNRVINELNLDLDIETLSGSISADAPPNSVLINLYVVNENPELSARIANSVAKNFDSLVQTLEVVSSLTSGGAVSVELIKPAAIPKYPSTPRKNLNLAIGLLIGLLLGISVALLRKFFENKVKNESHLSGVPLIATIRFDRSIQKELLITDSDTFSNRNESFRILRANILNKLDNNKEKQKVIAVMSSVAKEGKTSTVVNLGLSFSQAGFKVLLIETDLRKPTFLKYLKSPVISGSKDLVEYLKFTKSELDSKFLNTIPLNELTENCKLILAGESVQNPTELLSSDNLEIIIKHYGRDFDFILLDTAPVLLVADAVVVSRFIDLCLLVVSAGRTPVEIYAATVNLLRTSKVNILGSILNKVPRDKLGEYGYSIGSVKSDSYYGYGYYIPSSRYYTKTKKFPLKLKSKNLSLRKVIRDRHNSIRIAKILGKREENQNQVIDKDNFATVNSFAYNLERVPWLPKSDEKVFDIEDYLDSLSSRKKSVRKKSVRKKSVRKKSVGTKSVGKKSVGKKFHR
jgi:capsular exopolysaccharide synthesis family protein